MNIYLYGPPASGKTSLGRALASALDLPFRDLDELIANKAGRGIPEIFTVEGESGFRRRELAALEEVKNLDSVIALGGGALLNPIARQLAEETGQVLCLHAGLDVLLDRLAGEDDYRPLLSGNQEERLRSLLVAREAHYRSFTYRLDTDGQGVEELTWKAQVLLGRYRVGGMDQPYDAMVETGGFNQLGMRLRERGLEGPIALVGDQTVCDLYARRVVSALEASGYPVSVIRIEPGEAQKTIETVVRIWDGFVQAGIERGSTVVALGGGVAGDLTGFAAATFLRGVAWVNVPTTLLAMVDSSLGGKTGIDLPQAKNLAGAFHPPRLVLADVDVLSSLPMRELRNGLAEVVKHGIIGDPELFALCANGLPAVQRNLEVLVRRAMAVKVRVIEQDPYEKGLRQSLNLGHTVGHGIELASNYRLGHGEAVAIGTVIESELAEAVGLAENGLSQTIRTVLETLGLPVTIPAGISREEVIQSMMLDKKRSAGKLRFALPVRVGAVVTGVVIDNWQQHIEKMFSSQPGEVRP